MLQLYSPINLATTMQVFSTIPFYKEGETYRADIEVLAQSLQTSGIEAELQEKPNGNRYRDILKNCLETISLFRFSEGEVIAWLNQKQASPSLKQYHDALKDLRLQLFLRTVQDALESDNWTPTDPPLYRKPTKRGSGLKKRVLHKDNPFAGVDISDSTFLYPTKEGAVSSLSLTTEHTLRREGDEPGSYQLTLEPGFSIADQSLLERDTVRVDEELIVPLTTQERDYVYLN